MAIGINSRRRIGLLSRSRRRIGLLSRCRIGLLSGCRIGLLSGGRFGSRLGPVIKRIIRHHHKREALRMLCAYAAQIKSGAVTNVVMPKEIIVYLIEAAA